ncbi:hypothetical protein VTK73DRAFT_808 [Phialemonium thermophilum]|uniref:catechol O-methyltransferase n=1 Tax=Phialemonium thermophilum TaxID=223376 RepID=A0ABR3XCD7_9PEZI
MSLDHVDGFVERAQTQAVAMRRHVLSLPAEQLRGRPWDVIAAIEAFANDQGLAMLFRRPKIDVVRRVLAALRPRPKVVVEFGTFVGTSAIAWGAILRELNGSDATDIHVYGLELEPKMAEIATDMIRLAGLEDIVSVVVGPGSESLQNLVAEGKVRPGGLDMVFIDHWEKYYVPDLQLCEKLKVFHKGSIAVADNTDIPGAPAYLEYVKKGGDLENGTVRYESRTLYPEAADGSRPSAVEVSTVVEV